MRIVVKIQIESSQTNFSFESSILPILFNFNTIQERKKPAWISQSLFVHVKIIVLTVLTHYQWQRQRRHSNMKVFIFLQVSRTFKSFLRFSFFRSLTILFSLQTTFVQKSNEFVWIKSLWNLWLNVLILHWIVWAIK